MKSLARSEKGQRKARAFWRIVLVVSLLLLASPVSEDRLVPFETTLAAAFVGLFFFIIALVMLSLYRKRSRLLKSLLDPAQVLESWDSPDRFKDNHGDPIPAVFGRTGLFYAGQPYCIRSYDCTFASASVENDGGPVLRIVYTVPNSRNGAVRHKSTLDIPVPETRIDAANRLAQFYSEASRR